MSVSPCHIDGDVEGGAYWWLGGLGVQFGMINLGVSVKHSGEGIHRTTRAESLLSIESLIGGTVFRCLFLSKSSPAPRG